MGDPVNFTWAAKDRLEFDMQITTQVSRDRYVDNTIPCKAYGRLAELIHDRRQKMFVEGTLHERVLIKDMRFV